MNSLTHPRCSTKYAIDGVFTSLVYKGIVKKLIYKFKYNPYLSDLKNVLIDLFYENLIQKEGFYKVFSKDSLFIPIPLHKSKLKKRGYNQAEILAKGLSEKLGNPMLSVLERVKETLTQVGLSKEERKKNILGSLAVRNSVEVSKYPNIFLVDDILTTGATFSEAAKVLKRKGVRRVFGLALARD